MSEDGQSSPACPFASRSATPADRDRDAQAGPTTTASPSMVKLFARRRAAPSAMAGSRTVQSMAPTRIEPHALTVAADDQPIPVMFDLVKPFGAGRTVDTFHRLGRHDEPGREGTNDHCVQL